MERWIENPYWQYFTGEGFFQSKQPFDPSEFVHFRKRLKEAGLEFLLSQTVALHPEAANEKEVQIDTTVQEKNIAFPTQMRNWPKRSLIIVLRLQREKALHQDKLTKE